MYCNKCGKEIPNNVRFCTYCGEATENNNITYNSNSEYRPDANTLNAAGKNLIGYIGLAFLAILSVIYLGLAIKSFGGNNDAFDWVSSGYKTLGILLHWGIPAIAVLDCLACAANYIKQRNGSTLIGGSITIGIGGIFLLILSKVFSDWDTEDISIVMYRIFTTYGGLASVTIFFAIMLFIVGILLIKSADTKS